MDTIITNVFAGANADRLAFDFSYKDMIDRFCNGLPTEGYDLGGISGAPLLTVVDNKSGLQTWRLAGVIYEASPNLGIIYATPADFILADGRIKDADMPSGYFSNLTQQTE